MSTGSTYLPSLLSPFELQRLAESWLREDGVGFDVGGAVVGKVSITANVFCKEATILAGLPFFEAVCTAAGCTVEWAPGAFDGAVLAGGTGGRKVPIARVSGPADAVLRAERPALNAFSECSGVARAARHAVEVKESAGWAGRLAGTRKTIPGGRLLQKYGMVVGGMDAHRMDLCGMTMIKDNHAKIAGGVPHAVKEAKKLGGFAVKIDVECRDLAEALQAAQAGADVVMLDNFSAEEFSDVAKKVKKLHPTLVVEGSGGLKLENIKDYMVPEADVLSFSVNKYATPVDFSMDVVADPGVLRDVNSASKND